MAFALTPLPYAFDALEPHIDAATLEIHYAKHHQAYADKLNAALDPSDTKTIEEIMTSISSYPMAVRNNGGGFCNHELFWKMMSPNGGGMPAGELAQAIDAAFGSLDAFKQVFEDAAKNRFGSGWAWLVKKDDGTLMVTSTANQDNPLMDIVPENERGTPILGLDVWEHAYYLKYQNKRPDYIASWWNVVNWDEVAMRYAAGN